MTPQTILMLALAVRALLPGEGREAVEALSQPAQEAQSPEVRYQPESREVTNWRREAMDALEPKPVIAMAALFKAERPFVTRCVKLNNYWCIKSARWNGELATDSEGHVGFASADHGADAAATLLRRYYMDFNRKSALDIVRRWAPAECNVATGIGGFAMLAVRGIGGTVRAQYLASRRKKGGAVRYTAKAGPGGKPGRVSMVIPMAPKTPQYRVPSIAAGMGEKPKAEPPRRAPPKPAPSVQAAGRTAPKPTPAKPAAPIKTASAAPAACTSDEVRLQNYAARIVAPLGLKPGDDLQLFDAQGRPSPRLAVVMLAMSGFELGLLRPDLDLVEAAVRRMEERVGRQKAGPALSDAR